MATSARRAALWVVLATLAIAAAALLAGGVGASAGLDAGELNDIGTDVCADINGVTDVSILDDNGAQCVEITKVQEGGPDVAFTFDFEVDCDNDFSGSVQVDGGQSALVVIGTGATSCTVAEEASSSPGGLGDWTTAPSRVLTQNLVENGNNTTPFEFINTFIEPEQKEVRIVKEQIGGFEDFEFVFHVDCIEDEGTPERLDPVSISGSGTAEFLVEARYTHCTVVEFFDDEMDAERWATTVGQASDPGRELTVHFDQEGVASFLFQNEWIPPRLEDATVQVKKVFEGPAGWEFGFGFGCVTEDDLAFFALAGGESRTFDVEFGGEFPPIPVRPVADDQGGGNGLPFGLPCAVIEEGLAGDWTVDVDIQNADGRWARETIGTVAFFTVNPGDQVVVTFTNIPGYAAQPPTGEVTLPDITDGQETS